MRFQSSNETLLDFGHEFLVVCPRCKGRAVVRDRGASEDAARRIALTCPHCGLAQFWEQAGPGMLMAADTSKYPPGVVAMGGPVDWYFHLPLWLQTPCCGETLWAYNADHLAFIEDFVGAGLREHRRGAHGWRNQALAQRLPKWMTRAGNRDEVLRGVGRLRERLVAE